MSQKDLDDQNGEALPEPDPELTLDPPKQSREPGLPPPRD